MSNLVQRCVAGLAFVAVANFASCIFVAGHHRVDKDGSWHIDTDDDSTASNDASAKPEKTAQVAAAKKDEKADQSEKAAKEAKLAIAKLENEIDALDVESKRTEAKLASERAKRELDIATNALEQFRTVEMPTKVAEAELEFESSGFEIELGQLELQELVNMYKQDQFAESGKELVVNRDRRRLEFQTRRHEFAKKRLDTLKTYELPKAMGEKSEELAKAKEAFDKAELGVKKSELEAQAAAIKAKLKIDELTKPDSKPDSKSDAKPAAEAGT